MGGGGGGAKFMGVNGFVTLFLNAKKCVLKNYFGSYRKIT